jgi:hypothetical protein
LRLPEASMALVLKIPAENPAPAGWSITFVVISIVWGLSAPTARSLGTHAPFGTVDILGAMRQERAERDKHRQQPLIPAVGRTLAPLRAGTETPDDRLAPARRVALCRDAADSTLGTSSPGGGGTVGRQEEAEVRRRPRSPVGSGARYSTTAHKEGRARRQDGDKRYARRRKPTRCPGIVPPTMPGARPWDSGSCRCRSWPGSSRRCAGQSQGPCTAAPPVGSKGRSSG